MTAEAAGKDNVISV